MVWVGFGVVLGTASFPAEAWAVYSTPCINRQEKGTTLVDNRLAQDSFADDWNADITHYVIRMGPMYSLRAKEMLSSF